MTIGGRPRKGTMISPETGALLTRGVREIEVRWKGLAKTVRQPGYYAAHDPNDAVLVGDDLKPASDALRELKRLAAEQERTAGGAPDARADAGDSENHGIGVASSGSRADDGRAGLAQDANTGRFAHAVRLAGAGAKSGAGSIRRA